MDIEKFKKLEKRGAIAVTAGAFLFHVLYGITGGATAVISAVNDSIWEHVKIVFFPYLFYTIIEYLILKPAMLKRFLAAKLAGLLFIPPVLISFFYTYTGIIGFNVTAVDIASAVLWSILSFVVSYKLFISDKKIEKALLWLMIAAAAMLTALALFTYYPPHIPLFRDIPTGTYGIPENL